MSRRSWAREGRGSDATAIRGNNASAAMRAAALTLVLCLAAASTASDDALNKAQAKIDALKARAEKAETELRNLRLRVRELEASCTGACAMPDPTEAHNSRLRDAVDKSILIEAERQRRLAMDEEDASGNVPKEITIVCPAPPEVLVVDLPEEERDLNECLILRIQGPDLEGRLVLFCDGHIVPGNWGRKAAEEEVSDVLREIKGE